MIVMRVRQQHRVDRRQLLDLGQRRGPPEVGHLRSQQRVREQTSVPELDEQGRVADIGDRADDDSVGAFVGAVGA